MISFVIRGSCLSLALGVISSCSTFHFSRTNSKIISSEQKPNVEASAMAADLSGWTLREKIGQLLIVGYRDAEQVAELMPGAVALFAWSMKSAEQTRELTQQIRELGHRKLKAPLLIATDHEGGRVIRMRKGMTLFPEASLVGSSNDPDLARRVGRAVGQELAYLGIDANFAPVLDLGGAESFLGNRIWGQDPVEVATMTGAYIQGLHDVGVVSVAKHFPGHGTSGSDAHFSVPINDKKLRTLWSEDLHPFRRAVIERVPAIMTAHVRVPEVDRLPASMSSRFLSRILRDSFKFQGVIVTDDLEMKGAQESMLSAGDLALQALLAGSDMLLIVWSKKDQKEIVARIERAIQKGEWTEAELDVKLRRILRLKSDWVESPAWAAAHGVAESPLKSVSHLMLLDEINAKPLQWRGDNVVAVKDILTKKYSSVWRVALPKGAYAAYWKTIRPQDEVLVHERRMNSSALANIRAKFSSNECSSRVCLVLTEAAAETSEDFYHHIKTLVQSVGEGVSPASEANASPNIGAILWAHMGLMPKVERGASNTALVMLGGTGLPRFKQLSLELRPK